MNLKSTLVRDIAIMQLMTQHNHNIGFANWEGFYHDELVYLGDMFDLKAMSGFEPTNQGPRGVAKHVEFVYTESRSNAPHKLNTITTILKGRNK
ncbi:hypothetical protein PJKIFABJ_00173 [Pseudomonas phage PE09]|uniref:Uncharacterized protein n=2 Tax=Otagovirus TaxID=2560197 RepID=A0A7S8BD89_9CAUD|nr:hypothetical protein QGX22_gp081 [Pseudomonas phage PE09]YP_010768461.1 hypothetical protein QGX23_gp078 [Pseudomonas phage PN09]QHZ60109.1 hypothetical protein PJKIFABJ_00173 [Pseudomonas phage PE09]QPB10574.1 hypothetical protein PN09_153 [Pseudomonas phage PN09]